MSDMVHRLGGAAIANLRLKAHEVRLNPPGISVLLADSAEDAAHQMRAAFPNVQAILEQSNVVASATLEAIRAVGFDAIPTPSKRLPNHYRLTHPDGVAGFTDENLARLSTILTETEVE